MDTSVRSSRRVARPLGLALVLTIVGVACSGSATPTAATVDGERISRADLDDELAILMDNEQFRAESLGVSEASPTVDIQLATAWLENLIFQSVVDADLEERGIVASDEDLAAARAELEAGLGADVFNAFPEDFQETLVLRTANLALLQAELAGDAPTLEAQEAYFEENKDLYLAQCPSDRSVAHILVPTEAEAVEILDLLRAGEDFGTLAAARSQDPGSAAAGGVLGCALEGQFVPEFEAAMLGAEPGVPTEPVQTDFGFHVLLVQEPFVTFEQFQPAVAAELSGQASQVISDYFITAMAASDVEVDARYGTWVTSDTGAGIEPPTPPEPREGREPSADPLGATDPLVTDG